MVVPVRDDPRLEDCLASLCAADADGLSYEVIVVDNGPTEAMRRIVERFPARYLEEPRPGSYAARNRGIAASSGSIVAFTDADCVPPPGWIAELGRTFRDADCLAAVGPSYAVNGSTVGRWVQSVDDDRADRLRRESDVVFCDTRNLAVRRTVLDGGFDPTFRWAGDLELGLRLARAGVRVRYAPEIAVGHENPDSLVASARRGVRRGRGLAALERKHGPAGISGARPLRVLGRDVKPSLLRAFSWRPLRPIGVAVAASVMTGSLLALSALRLLRLDWRHGLRPYRFLDRSSILLGRLLG